MQALTQIALDIMGADLGPQAALSGARLALEKHPQLSLLLVGDEAQILPFTEQCPASIRARIAVVPATGIVAMSDSPKEALRNARDSSMRLAIECVKRGQADACVSSGNTGALVAIAKFVLKTIEGVRRPALLTPIPADGGVTVMLDVGANTQCSAHTLAEFAVMGSLVASTDYELPHPRIGLLNIGVEAGKGHEVLHEADAILKNSSLNYLGFVEANQICSNDVDVVVSDGFTGNIALKAMEGFSRFIAARVGNGFSNAVGLDPRAHNGASLVGLRNVVIKSHGGADEIALSHAIDTAIVEAQAQLPLKIADGISRLELM